MERKKLKQTAYQPVLQRGRLLEQLIIVKAKCMQIILVKGIEAWSEISGRHSSAGKARRHQWILTGDPEPDNNPLNLIQASWSTYME